MDQQQRNTTGFGVPLRRRAGGHSMFPFGSLRELADYAGRTLDVAEEVPLYYHLDGMPPAASPIVKYKGIYNRGLQDIATITSKDYYLVQHKDAITIAIEGLAARGIGGYGVIHNGRSAAAAEILFTNLQGNTHGYEVGIRLENSFNKTTAVKGMIYLEMVRNDRRLHMTFCNVIPGGSFYSRHSQRLRIDLPLLIARFVDTLDPALSAIDNLIAFAIEAHIQFPSEESLITTLGTCIGNIPRAGDIIAKQWNGNLNITRWDLFEMTLRYVHQETLPYGLYMSLSSAAERIVNVNIPMIPIVEEHTEAHSNPSGVTAVLTT